MKKKLFTFSVLLNIVLILFIGGASFWMVHRIGIPMLNWELNPFKKIQKPPYLAYGSYLNRMEHQETLPIEEDEIIFLGDSIIEQGKWHELFGMENVKNRGIGGDYLGLMLTRLDEIVKRKPKKLFIEIGTNDLSLNYSVPSMIRNYKRAIEYIQQHSPETKIYVHSLFPLRGDFWRGIRNNRHIREANEALFLLAKNEGCTYINVFDDFVDEKGELKEALSNDGLHLNGKGYLLWKEKIEHFVRN